MRSTSRQSKSGPASGDREWAFHHRLLIGVGVVTAVILLLLFLWQAVYVLLLAFAGVLFAIFLRAMSDFVASWARLPDGLALGLVVLGLAGLITALSVALVPRISEQVVQLQREVPVAVDQIVTQIEQYELGRAAIEEMQQMAWDEEFRPLFAARAATAVTTTFTAIGVVLLVFFVGLYLAASPGLYTKGVLRLLPKHRRPRGEEILRSIGYALKWWLIGRMLAMTFVGVITFLGLWLLGVPLALSLGLVAAILDFIPNIGPIIAAVPAVLLAFVISPMVALYVIIFYTIVQQVESYIVTPIVQHRVVRLPPALTIVAQVLFFLLLGWIGLILATPITVAAMEFIKGVYVHDVLGDRGVELLVEESEESAEAVEDRHEFSEQMDAESREKAEQRPAPRARRT